ncbi:PotD/PotF family extracellular solute-binding protein [Acidocella sp. KAb 2-4]|uniref:ABC transporter substrate-binding protein n=1 Tax=Acidocella sp. KAb 2-4 TaxID=2885158 RepID=UPI001D07603C|nr:spermidine/putrescine ABC transporter substrate-binding protein [Acidocella sp. KAb 2-4]MCB5944545.1 spermidine/putrescine ABC transporter substrate-binding protein [Acidocella sp. KAb 2-4]
MKLLSCLAVGALALGLGAPQIARAETPTLNLFIWSDYIDPALITKFEKQCNCKVVETDYESNAEMEAKLRAGGDAQYDVVVPSSYYVPELEDEGLIQPLDHGKLTNFSNLAARFQNPTYDPGDKYSIPYQWGTTGILYDPAKIKGNPDGWGLLFDPKENPNYPFVIPKGEGRDQIGAACAYLGYGFNCAEKSQWIAAAKLIEQTKKRPNFAGFVDETPTRDQEKSGLVAAGMAYNGDVGQCVADGSCTKLKFYLPKEGSEIWVDTMAIPAKAPHPELGLEFINFILDANNGADLSNFNQYASPNAASQKQLTGIMASDLINPSDAEMKNLVFLAPLRGAKYKLFNQIWTSVLQ